jgi:hypothetical protein
MKCVGDTIRKIVCFKKISNLRAFFCATGVAEEPVGTAVRTKRIISSQSYFKVFEDESMACDADEQRNCFWSDRPTELDFLKNFALNYQLYATET